MINEQVTKIISEWFTKYERIVADNGFHSEHLDDLLKEYYQPAHALSLGLQTLQHMIFLAYPKRTYFFAYTDYSVRGF